VLVFRLALSAFLFCAWKLSASPVVASLQTILAAPPLTADGMPTKLYRWDRFPSILIIDTIDYSVQECMFSRLAFFLEKRGFRGRLLNNSELQGMHGWNAHDYSPEGVAAFFNAAQRIAFKLNPEELRLRDLALEEGLITRLRGRFAPGFGGVICISQASSLFERRLLLTHESFHGIFFASLEYRLFCFRLWDSLDPGLKRFIARFLQNLGYDVSFRYLVVNEFQAYIMQQPLSFGADYFKRVATRFGQGEGIPVGDIVNAANRLDSFLVSHFGIRAGGSLEIRQVAGSR
jgi:hypothetical protein